MAQHKTLMAGSTDTATTPNLPENPTVPELPKEIETEQKRQELLERIARRLCDDDSE